MNTDSMRIFQIATPSIDKFVSLIMYNHKDVKYNVIIRGKKNITQEDIDFVIRNASVE